MPRASKPATLKLITGKPAPVDAPRPDDGTPQCPSDEPAVLIVWNEVVGHLSRMKVLTPADRDVLHTYCEAVVQYRDVTAILAREGIAIKATPNGASVPHPLLKVQNDLTRKLQSLANEFGLTPAARTKIKTGDSKPAQHGAARLLSS